MGNDLADEGGLALRLIYRILNEHPGSLTIDTNLYLYDPIHQTFINIYEDADLRQQVIFNASNEPNTYYLGRPGCHCGDEDHYSAGMHHILIGPDHILFLDGLLCSAAPGWPSFASSRRSRWAQHHAVPGGAESRLAAGEYHRAGDRAEHRVRRRRQPRRGDGRDLRAWVARRFGLIHGFGFANVLREFGLPREALGWSLFSFNLGVEIGQLAVVLAVASLLPRSGVGVT